MKFTTKMMLVPEHSLTANVGNEAKNNGIDQQVTEFRRTLLDILSDGSLTPEMQMQQYYQLFHRYSKLDKESKEPATLIIKQSENQESKHEISNVTTDKPEIKNKWVEQVFKNLPRVHKRKAEGLVDFLKNADEFTVNNQGEISINNERLPNTHIVDLIHDVIRDRPAHEAPHGHETFIKMLKRLNVPNEFIGNKNRKRQIQQEKVTSSRNEDEFYTPKTTKKRLNFSEKKSSNKKPKNETTYEKWD